MRIPTFFFFSLKIIFFLPVNGVVEPTVLSSDETWSLVKIAREHKRGSQGTSPDLKKSTQFYLQAVNHGSGPGYRAALFELASIQTQSSSENFSLLSRASDLGHPVAQHQLATSLFTGIGAGGTLTPRDPGRALLLEQFSALAGVPEAHLGMGYRYLMGEGVPKSCEHALKYYEFAANEAAWQFEGRGYSYFVERSYLAREVEDGAAGSSAGAGRGEVTSDMVNYYEHLADELDQNSVLSLAQIYSQGSKSVKVDMSKVVKYLYVAATELKLPAAAGQLGYMLVSGMDTRKGELQEDRQRGAGLPLNNSKVLELLQFSYDNHDSWGILGMGFCYYKGGCEGVNRNLTRALECFQRVNNKHAEASFYIGDLLMGMGGLFDVGDLVQEGVAGTEGGGGDDAPPAPLPPSLAEIQVDVASAFQFYSSASSRGHLLATHRLGQIQQRGGGVIEDAADKASMESEKARGLQGGSLVQRKSNRRGRGGAAIARSCEGAVSAFRLVAERGDWAQQLTTAHSLYSAGDRCGALRLFSQLASIGYETAQANAAFILSQSPPACLSWVHPDTVESLRNSESKGVTDEHGVQLESVAILKPEQWEASRNYSEFTLQKSDKDSAPPASNAAEERVFTVLDLFGARALSFYRQSALLGNAASFRKMGDMYYYGSGGLSQDKQEAALLYQLAADYGQTHAMFNLGVMHEIGDGVVQDFHLAKRYYDQTAEYDPRARYPSALAVYFLQAHKRLQDYAGKEVTDRLGSTFMKILNPLLQAPQLNKIISTIFFPDDSGASPSATTTYQLNENSARELSSLSIFIWKCWDKFYSIWDAVTVYARDIFEYLKRFLNRFSKSPQQAVSSLFAKVKSFLHINTNAELNGNNAEATNTKSSDDLLSSSLNSLTPDSSLAADAKSDFELILLLTLMVIFLVLVDHRRQSLRAKRQRARERRRRQWDTVTVFEMRDLIKAASVVVKEKDDELFNADSHLTDSQS